MYYNTKAEINKFNEMYKQEFNLDMSTTRNRKVKITCLKCKRSFEAALNHMILSKTGCYTCNKNKDYSIDEIKCLEYIMNNYIPEHDRYLFCHAKNTYRQNTINITSISKELQDKGYIPPGYYKTDGYIRKTYEYKDGTLSEIYDRMKIRKGTVFEVLGDYFHSNLLYYNPDDRSPCKERTHKENYEYTINRLKHIEELGYKVYYIWITDFRRYLRDRENGNKVNIFDYMNLEKTNTTLEADYTLLPGGSQKILHKKNIESFNDF